MLDIILFPKKEDYSEENDKENFWFLQDGATSHTARHSGQLLQEQFPGGMISLRGDVPWSPRSPDLSSLDYFLWGYLTSEVYKVRERTLEALKEVIADVITEITPAMLARVFAFFFKHRSSAGRYNF